MRPSIRFGAALGGLLGALLLGGARPAHAHFLWAEVAPAPQPSFRLSFGEAAGDPTPPELLERIRPARATTPDGKPLPLQPGDGALVASLPAGTKVAGAGQRWGVLDRSAEGRGVFLLQYYAKAAGDAAAAAAKAGLHVEVFARPEGGSWVVTVLHGTRPEAGAELNVQCPGGAEPLALKTDAKGEARFSASGAGKCAIRALAVENERGEFEGKPYTLKRYYSTLTFPIAAPLAGAPAGADPAAYALLKEAHDRRATMGNDFPGITAAVVFTDSDRTATGRLSYSPREGLQLQVADLSEASRQWLEGQLRSILAHRRGGDFSQGDGRYPITFGGDDHSPLGRLVQLNDGLQSSYRVRDQQIVEVNRKAGDERFTITVLETTPVEAGKYLPRHFSVTYFDAETGAIRRVQQFTDRYARTGSAWYPTARRVITAEKGAFTTRLIELRDVRLLPTPGGAGAAADRP
jgi:hypothetical protein